LSTNLGRLAHVQLRVHELDAAVAFYGRLLGLVEVDRAGSTVYLSGRSRPGWDLVLSQGGQGLDHFAFVAESEQDLEAAESAVRAAGSLVEPLPEDDHSGARAGIRFTIPSGHVMELVVLGDPVVYLGGTRMVPAGLGGIGPLLLDHITLMTSELDEVVEFLTSVLSFRCTELLRGDDGVHFGAFLRTRDQHHDLALFRSAPEAGPLINHVAFRIGSIDDIRRACDIASEHGWQLDCSPGRHVAGNNLFLYIRDPSGNRTELSGDLAQIEIGAQTRVLTSKEHRFDMWGQPRSDTVESGIQGAPPLVPR
jgi:catechol 2,3-dioxygenase